MITLYSAERCPYAARARIALAEKGVEVETVEDRPVRPARLAVREESRRPRARHVEEDDGTAPLPESVVIMEFLEERYPEPPLLPADPADRDPQSRLLIFPRP